MHASQLANSNSILGFSAQRFRTLFELAPTPLVIFSSDGSVTGANKAWEFLFDTSMDELIDYNVFQDKHAEDLGLLKQLKRAFAGETIQLEPFLYDPAKIGKRGRPRWLEAYIYPIFSETGDVFEVVVFEQDLTDQILAHNTLKESEQHFRFLADSIPALVWIKDSNKRCTYVNRRWLDFTGASLDEQLKLGWQNRVHPEDAKRVMETFQWAFDRREAFEMEFRIRSKNNDYHWVFDREEPRFDESGVLIGYIGSCVDITDRKVAEKFLVDSAERARFRANTISALGESLDYEITLTKLAKLVAPSMADWCSIQILDSDGQLKLVTLANADPTKEKWAYEFYGTNPTDMRSQTGPAKVVRTGQPEFYPEISDKIIESTSLNDTNLQFIKTLGLISYVCAPLKVRGSILGTLCLATSKDSNRSLDESDLVLALDLAERAGFAIDNARLYEQAQNSNRVKDEFLATLSHELRTPLNVIQGHAEILKSEMSDLNYSDIQKSIEVIHRNVKTQARIIEDLLDVSRIITGKVGFKPVAVAPSELARLVIDNIRATADAKKIDLTYNFLQAPKAIRADPDRFQQIVWNLLTNAIKFTHECGSVNILIKELGDNCLIQVTDNGIGIDRKFLPFMFERFRQGDSSFTRRHGGLGLGLSIVRHLTEMHGGTVSAESKGIGHGSKFRVLLPIALVHKVNATEIIPLKETDDSHCNGEIQLHGVNVLLVEDSEDSRMLAKYLLCKAGATVHSVESTEQARTHLQNHQPHIIISDIGMPNEDGITFIKRWREVESKLGIFIPAIALTAYVRSEEKEKAIKAGFQVHLPKPVTRATLLKAVSNLIKHKCYLCTWGSEMTS